MRGRLSMDKQAANPVQAARWSARMSVAALVLVCLTAIPGVGAAGGPLEEEAVVTEHTIVVDGAELRYAAETGRIAIRDAETGVPRGHMFYIAYRVPSDRPRPLAFVWNGGPGAPSALLHFEAAGPKRYQDGALVVNADTWLTAMDLVFVDPIGTGFSRPAQAEYADAFYGTIGDVASVTEFVRAWRLLHGAEAAPLLLIGESWGAGRAGSVGYALEQRGIGVRALVLISGGTGLDDNPVPGPLRQALRIADLSATALHHGRLTEGRGRPAAEVRARAEAWARDSYAPALERSGELSPQERNDVIAGLARFSGLPPKAIDPDTLVITPRGYRESLLKDAGQTLQVFDMRLTVTDPAAAHGEDGPGRSDVIPRYLREDLGYRTSLPYVGLEPLEEAWAPGGAFPRSVNERWDYATAELTQEEVQAAIQEAIRHGGGPPRLGPPLPSAAEAVGLNPELRVWVAAGRFDSLNSCTANDELGRRLPADLRAAYTFACYEGGHMMYRDERARAELARHVRELAAGVR